MRFLLYVNHLGRKGANGTAITLLAKDLSNFLKEKGHEVLIVGNKNIVEEEIDVDYEYLWREGKINGDLGYAKRLADIIKLYKPDVIHAFMRPMSTNLALSTFFHRGNSTLYLGSVHNTDNHMKKSKFYHLPYRFFLKSLLERLDFMTGPSKAVIDDIKKAFFLSDSKCRVLPNFIDYSKINRFADEKIEDDIPDNYLLNIGRLENQKNQIGLLRIFRKVLDRFPDEYLVIIGEGSLKEELKKVIKDLSLEKNVFLLGYRENPWKYYKRAKMFLLTSIFEGFGLVLIESLYFKVPIVSFDIPSSVEITENGKYGLIAKSYDEDDFVQKVVSLLEDKHLYETLKEDGYNKAMEFSIENYPKFVDRFLKSKG